MLFRSTDFVKEGLDVPASIVKGAFSGIGELGASVVKAVKGTVRGAVEGYVEAGGEQDVAVKGVVAQSIHSSKELGVDVAEAADGIVTNSAAAIYESFTIANDMLNGRDWFFDHFIPADMHFFWCYRRAKQFELDLERFNHCQAHFDRVSERPSVVKVLELEKSVQAKFAS